MTRTMQAAAIAAIFGFLASGTTAALAAGQLPPIHKSGAVEYINGGVGSAQARAIEQASAHWPLTITYAEKDHKRGEFVVDVKTVVRDAKGDAVFSLGKSGPIVLAKLSPGDYTVDATLRGKTLSEKVQIKPGEPAKIELMWPAGTTA